MLPPGRVPIFHSYADAPPDGIEVLAYDYVEAFAEKFRALPDRTRPRVLYDVLNLYRNTTRSRAPMPPRYGAMSRLAGRPRSTINSRPCCQSILLGQAAGEVRLAAWSRRGPAA